MLFICINVPRLAEKDVTSRDSFLKIVAQTIHFSVWSGAQARGDCVALKIVGKFFNRFRSKRLKRTTLRAFVFRVISIMSNDH